MGWLFGDSKSVLDSTMPSEIDIIQHWIFHYDHGNEGSPKKMCKESKTKVTLKTVKSVITHVQNLYPNRDIMSQESVRTKLTRLILKAEGLILKHKKDKMDNISWISGEQEKMKLKLFDVWKQKTKLVDPPPPSPKRKLDEIEENLFFPVLICQKIKQEIPETCDKSKPFNEPEKVEASGIFVKSETDTQPEIIFGISDSDSKHDTSTVSNDPLQISVYEGKEVSQQENCYRMDIYNPVTAPLSAVTPGAPSGLQGQQTHTIGTAPLSAATRAAPAGVQGQQTPTIGTVQTQNSQGQKLVVKSLGQYTVTFKGNQMIVNGTSIAQAQRIAKQLSINGKQVLVSTKSTVQKLIQAPIKCQFCPKKFREGTGMSMHVTSVHAIKCQFCPAKFLTSNDVNDHIKKAHEANNQSTYPDSKSKKRRKCSICYKDNFYCLC